MVEIYDIMDITCQNLYHMQYQPLTYITPRAVGPWGDIGFSGWYSMWYRFGHVIFSIYQSFVYFDISLYQSFVYFSFDISKWYCQYQPTNPDILKSISQCEVKLIMTLLIKTRMIILRFLTYITTSITAFSIRLAMILTIMSRPSILMLFYLYQPSPLEFDIKMNLFYYYLNTCSLIWMSM